MVKRGFMASVSCSGAVVMGGDGEGSSDEAQDFLRAAGSGDLAVPLVQLDPKGPAPERLGSHESRPGACEGVQDRLTLATGPSDRPAHPGEGFGAGMVDRLIASESALVPEAIGARAFAVREER